MRGAPVKITLPTVLILKLTSVASSGTLVRNNKNYNVRVTRSLNYGCNGKAISVTYSECVCRLSYTACRAHALYYIVVCGLSVRATSLNIMPNTARLWGGGGLSGDS